MPLDSLLKARKKVIGSKQTLKMLGRHQVKAVYLAKNAEKKVIEPIVQVSMAQSVPVIYAENMLTLGRACGIDVGCAAAAIVEE